MTSLIVNVYPLGSAQDVASRVKAWLAEAHFGAASADAFVTKWTQLTEDARKVVAGLLDAGGHNVKEQAVRHAVMRLFDIDSDGASGMVRRARLEFMKTDLVTLIHDQHSGGPVDEVVQQGHRAAGAPRRSS